MTWSFKVSIVVVFTSQGEMWFLWMQQFLIRQYISQTASVDSIHYTNRSDQPAKLYSSIVRLRKVTLSAMVLKVLNAHYICITLIDMHAVVRKTRWTEYL